MSFDGGTSDFRIDRHESVRVRPYQYGDVVTLGDDRLDVEMLPQLLKIAQPEDAATEVAPYRVVFGAVNQAVALHDFIHNILNLN